MSPGPDPIKHSSVEFDSTLENWAVREAKISHVTDLIGPFQHSVKLYAEILFIRSDPIGVSLTNVLFRPFTPSLDAHPTSSLDSCQQKS